jgi:uncharacterized membrane protein YeaQ/YmgE (transglycosylase-associated protein family)
VDESITGVFLDRVAEGGRAMETLWMILTWALFGLVIGAIARLLLPGRQPMGLLMTILLGVIGSLAGGFISWLFWPAEPYHAAGFIMSVVGAVLVLWLYVMANRSGTTRTYP